MTSAFPDVNIGIPQRGVLPLALPAPPFPGPQPDEGQNDPHDFSHYLHGLPHAGHDLSGLLREDRPPVVLDAHFNPSTGRDALAVLKGPGSYRYGELPPRGESASAGEILLGIVGAIAALFGAWFRWGKDPSA
jgi:hypothetical protein